MDKRISKIEGIISMLIYPVVLFVLGTNENTSTEYYLLYILSWGLGLLFIELVHIYIIKQKSKVCLTCKANIEHEKIEYEGYFFCSSCFMGMVQEAREREQNHDNEGN